MESPANPLLDLLGLAVAKASFDRKGTHLVLQDGKEVAALFDAAAQAEYTGDAGSAAAGTKDYAGLLKRLRGMLVSDVRYDPGASIVLTFGGSDAELRVSLKGAALSGDVAAALQVRGGEWVHFHEDGVTRLSLRDRR